ncbi:hypothetical protein BDK92_4809 [Micromonospora pisi]|uniref:Uncharacterized protein n=1 Tax=Micromonospora pisi TaxID=589240 RepID=A0A495JN50_9ACTN|nr:hypothetical protein [Micromonospora pisi]RKR90436.1 hypothetical protein BDK92_4809 [Micromonospora pisi]
MHVSQREQDEQVAGNGPQTVQPVFLDQTGRRRRLTVTIGSGVAAALLASLALIGLGLFGGTSAVIPGWPGGDSGSGPRPETRIEEMSPSPGSAGRNDQVSVTAPTHVATRSSVPAPPRPAPSSVSPLPSSGVTTQPGQGGLHRNTPSGRPDKSPGKPS